MVAFGEVPELVLDATTSAEDRTFWANSGFDAPAIISAAAEGASGSRERGASTITQQLVRARLLPSEVTSAGADRYMRKAKELIQAMRVSETFPGEQGKDRIITAYLNEIFYGHGAYGIAAAALIYFGVSDLAELTPAQAALLAGLPKSPSTLDPYRYAVRDDEGRLVVPPDAPPVVRRDWILDGLGEGARWTKLTQTELAAARAEPVVLAGEQALTYKAAHFTWQVRRQLDAILGSAEKVETGGYKVITTLDMKAQGLAEKWLTAGAIVPNVSRKKGDALMKALKIPKADRSWVRALRGKDLHNGALVALDYRTGDVLAYAGSAGYYRDNMTSKKFSPKYDAAGDGSRQPGSAFKPILYAAAFNAKVLTPGSLLLDVTTEFNRREDWAPRDADQLERGPVLVRKALQYSLNIPAIRTLERVGNSRVDKTAEALGLRFTGGREAYMQSGLAGALGHGRGPAARPDLGLRRAGERRCPGPAADDPRDRGPRRQGRLAGSRARGHGRPSRRRPPSSSPTSWPATPTRSRTRSGRRSWRCTTGRAGAAARPRSRPARRTTRATWRPTATSRRRRTTARPSPSASGWATATTPTRARGNRPSR